MATNLTPSAVTRVMKGAGGEVSKKYKGRIKGLVEHTSGYRSEKISDESVRLNFYASSLARSSSHIDVIREKIVIAQNTLEDKGYTTEQRVNLTTGIPYLLVKK